MSLTKFSEQKGLQNHKQNHEAVDFLQQIALVIKEPSEKPAFMNVDRQSHETVGLSIYYFCAKMQ